MRKITAFVGSAHKKNTHKVTEQFLNNLQAFGDIEYEIVTISDYEIKQCRGCRVCFEHGEHLCPLKDDRDALIEKIDASDGVIFATPNYSWHMSGIMKSFIDRLGYICHRPRYFGKVFTTLVTQGIAGGDKIVENLDLLGKMLGFTPVKGVTLTILDPITEKAQQKVDQTLKKLSAKYYAQLMKNDLPAPSMFMLMGFRMGRSSMLELLDNSSADYRYYAEKGWFESEYYYPTQLGLIKNLTGKLFDRLAPTLRDMIA